MNSPLQVPAERSCCLRQINTNLACLYRFAPVCQPVLSVLSFLFLPPTTLLSDIPFSSLQPQVSPSSLSYPCPAPTPLPALLTLLAASHHRTLTCAVLALLTLTFMQWILLFLCWFSSPQKVINSITALPPLSCPQTECKRKMRDAAVKREDSSTERLLTLQCLLRGHSSDRLLSWMKAVP